MEYQHRRVDFVIVPKGSTACQIKTVYAKLYENGTLKWEPIGETVLVLAMVFWDGARLENACLCSEDTMDVPDDPQAEEIDWTGDLD